MKFIASRLSDGNKIFPPEIKIEDNGISIKVPGLFSNQEQYFAFNQIDSVAVETPLIGYSTISFYAGLNFVKAHGFTKSEVTEIKQIITDGKLGKFVNNNSNSSLQHLLQLREMQKEAAKLAEQEREDRRNEAAEEQLRNWREMVRLKNQEILNDQKWQNDSDEHEAATDDTEEFSENADKYYEIIEIKLPEDIGENGQEFNVFWFEDGRQVKKGEFIDYNVKLPNAETGRVMRLIAPIDGIAVGMIPNLDALRLARDETYKIPTLRVGDVLCKIIGEVKNT